jgi:hypothetical protein
LNVQARHAYLTFLPNRLIDPLGRDGQVLFTRFSA